MLTEIRTREAAPVAPDRPASDHIDQQFEGIAKNFTVIDLSTARIPDRNRITVMLELPHLKKYGREPTLELVYGCNFAVAVGDLVSCPPTPYKSSWTTGMVVALDGGSYKGPVKHVRKIRTPPPSESGDPTS